ncbi:universal stress protein [Leifsonia sp. A12D58]|uniref:universal stress protein n=1 Tax=Leifsonia sp. A12D58 TaxID=3397674 RepID=UPI0039DF5779
MADHAEVHKPPVVVGVAPGQPARIVIQAARFAAEFDTSLICAHVNPGRFVVSESADGSVVSSPIDPDFADNREVEFDRELAETLSTVLTDTHVDWSTRVLVGDVPTALGHLADTVNASMIVVGTHDRSFSGGVQEFFNRSIAIQLAHTQLRPVVVVPSRAPGAESRMPWESA